MNCEWIKNNVALYVYDELADDARFEFEQHIHRCPGCRQEVASLQDLKLTMSALPVVDPTPDLLSASRMCLQEALEDTIPNRGWRRFTFDVAGWLHQMKFSPALTAALLIFGFTGGMLTTYKTIVSGRIAPNASASVDSASIVGGFQSITGDRTSKQANIQYYRLQPDTLHGSLYDPEVQRLLLFALQDRNNPRTASVRMDSVDMLSQMAGDRQIRESLIDALRYDGSDGVRLKALNALRPYVAEDIRVRDVVLETLENPNSNPGIRSEAFRLIESAKADLSVRQALSALANDDNPYLRTQSRRVLANLPEIE